MSNGVRYLKGRHGQKVAVVLGLRQYRRLLEKAEELAEIRAYDASKASKEKPVPYEKARVRILRRVR